MSQSDLARLRASFENVGYRIWNEFHVVSAGDICYRYGPSQNGPFHLCYLQYKPISKSYSLRVGAFHDGGMITLGRILPNVMRCYPKPVQTVRVNEQIALCWTLFDVGRALNWRTLSIPDPLGREAWVAQFEDFLEHFAKPIFWPANDLAYIIEILFREDTPFEWNVGYPIIRAAECIVLAKLMRIDAVEIRDKVLKFKNALTKEMHGPLDCEEMIDHFIQIIYDK